MKKYTKTTTVKAVQYLGKPIKDVIKEEYVNASETEASHIIVYPAGNRCLLSPQHAAFSDFTGLPDGAQIRIGSWVVVKETGEAIILSDKNFNAEYSAVKTKKEK